MSGAARVPALGPGDRAPNLTLPDLKGRTRKLYLEVTGGPIVIATAPDPLAGPGRTILDGLARYAGRFAKAGAHRFVLTRRPPSDSAVLDALVWIDPYGAAMELFRPVLGGGEPSVASVAVLDANQRLVGLFPAETSPDPVTEALWLAEQLAGEMAATPGDLDRVAPVLGLSRLLPEELCAQIAALGADRPLDDAELKRGVAVRLGARLGNEIRRTFQFRPVLRFEPFRVADAGAMAEPRRGADEDEPRRRFVTLVGLSDEQPGIVFPEYGPHVYRLAPGAALAFSCELLYRVVADSQTPLLTTVLSEPPAAS